MVLQKEKLEKENIYLDLQIRMTKHYSQRNQFAREKLKKAQIEIQALKREKRQAKLSVLAQASL